MYYIKIIIVNDYASVQGGAAQIAVTSARGLADAGYSVTFVYGTGLASSILNHQNIRLICFDEYDLLTNPSRLNAMKDGIWNRRVEIKMRSLLRHYDVSDTVVHVHSWVKSLSVSVVSATHKCGFPLVVTLHDYFSVCPNGGFYNYPKQSVCHCVPMSGNCFLSNCDVRNYSHKLWRFFRQLFYEKAGVPTSIKSFISVSKFSENILRDFFPDNAVFWDIENPIDILDVGCSTPEHYKTFSFIGRLSPEKGVKVFADAVKRSNVNACFVGDGDLKVTLQEQSDSHDFPGWVSHDLVVNYIQKSRAIIFPSQWYETQGLIVAEAAALGVPAIVASTCAASKFIIDGVTGLLFESGNVIDLAEKMELLDKQPEYAKQLGENAYFKYWANPNDMEKHLSKLVKCYDSILLSA